MTTGAHQTATPAPMSEHGVALAEIARRLSEIERTEDRRAGASEMRNRLLALFGSAITAGAIALGGWVWSVQADVGQIRSDVARGAERLEEHRQSGGGHPASVIARIAVNEGRIESNAASAMRVEGRLVGVEDKLEEILERLPRRRR